ESLRVSSSLFESLRVSSSGLLGRQRAFRPARIPTEGSRRGPRRNKARLQRCRKPNPAASLQPAQSWWISLGRKSHARIGAEAACHRTYGLVLGADLNRSESSRGGGAAYGPNGSPVRRNATYKLPGRIHFGLLTRRPRLPRKGRAQPAC